MNSPQGVVVQPVLAKVVRVLDFSLDGGEGTEEPDDMLEDKEDSKYSYKNCLHMLCIHYISFQYLTFPNSTYQVLV